MRRIKKGVAVFIASVVCVQGFAAGSLEADLAGRLNAVTSSFEADGGRCPIGRPKLVLDVVPSFGMYDEQENSLHLTTWDKLTEDEHTRYASMVSARNLKDAQGTYERGTYSWVFVHELGHWWQHCKGVDQADSYGKEDGADRIAAAYWRLKDPKLMKSFAELFASLKNSLPDPIPPGANKRAFFNENYDALGHNPPAYIWYQAAMIVDADSERPLPTLKEALLHPVSVAPER